MSSTTDRERGQVLVLFAGGVIALLLMAALAFDAGSMLLERRAQVDASDAAALAGARYLPANAALATNAALAIAKANGYTDGVGDVSVKVHIPPVINGPYTGAAGAIEVDISNTRPSIFAGLMGVANWPVGAQAVAVNQDHLGTGFSMLALDPTDCKTLMVTGNGTVTANGNIQVNSNCATAALFRQGGGSITVDAAGAGCNIVGGPPGYQSNGSGSLNCTVVSPAPKIPDPLAGLPAPPQPALANDMVQIPPSSLKPPSGCPGSASPATVANPAMCQFPNSNAYKGTAWRLYPGLYPGGLNLLSNATFYLEPGIYWIGGGGVHVGGGGGGGATVMSVATGTTTPVDYGVLIYNTQLPKSAIGPVNLDGSAATIKLWPLKATGSESIYNGIVIFQDRNYNINGNDVTINGSASTAQVRGTIYVPSGDVLIDGSGGAVTTDQVIGWTFTITGAPGSSINVLYDTNFMFTFNAAGLVQ